MEVRKAVALLTLFVGQSFPQASVAPLPDALALFNAGKYRECFELISPYTAAHPEKSEAHKILGMSQFMLGDVGGALLQLKRATELNPSDPDGFYYLGRLYFTVSDPLDALPAFQRAIQLAPSSVRAHNQLGQTYEALNRLPDAEREYKTAIELDGAQTKRSEWPYYNLGLLCFRAGRMPEAIGYFRTAISCRSAFPEAQVKLALILETQNLNAEAFTLLDQAIREDPKYPEAHYRLALLLTKAGRQREAEEQFALFRQYRSRQ